MLMVRRLTAVAASVGVFLTASLAQAQARPDFGKQGEFIFSADRLVPLFGFTSAKQDQPSGGNTKVTGFCNESSISLLWGSSAGACPAEQFFTVPRLGFDYTVIPQLTVGGDLVLFFTLGGNSGTDTTAPNGTQTTVKGDNPGTWLFGVAPRVGYIIPLTDLFAFWLRGGLSFYTASSKVTLNQNTTRTTSVNQFAIDLDPQFVITPVPHFGFTVGLTADIPITGGHSTETDSPGVTQTTSNWSSILFIGVTGGVLGYF
jgi:hypothetical protein